MSEKIHFDAFAEQVALEAGYDIETARDYIYSMCEAIIEANEKGEAVRIRNFGNFHPVFNKARRAVNPQTGNPMTIPAHYHVNFKPSRDLSTVVNVKYAHLHPTVLSEQNSGKWWVIGAVAALLIGLGIYLAMPGDTTRKVAAPTVAPETVPAVEALPEPVPVPKVPEVSDKEERYMPPEVVPAPEVIREPGVYTVNKSDTLWDIAKTVYANADFWPAIFKRNTQIVTDPDLIYPETELEIPSRPDLSVPAEVRAMGEGYVKAYRRYKEIDKNQKALWLLFRGYMHVDKGLLEYPGVLAEDRDAVLDYVRRFAQ
jgi:nucleoid DNA-binding protein/LysM repeat protein